MIVKPHSYVKEHLEEMIEQVNNDNEVIKITSDKYNAVLMSEDYYKELIEKLK